MRIRKENLKLLSIMLAVIVCTMVAGCKRQRDTTWTFNKENKLYPPNWNNNIDKNQGGIVIQKGTFATPGATEMTCWVGWGTPDQRSQTVPVRTAWPYTTKEEMRFDGLKPGTHTVRCEDNAGGEYTGTVTVKPNGWMQGRPVTEIKPRLKIN